MSKSIDEIIQEVGGVFSEVLEQDDIHLTRETTAANVEGWDSLAHIQLVVAIEKHFKVRFTAAEIQSWKNVGAMCDALAQRLN